MKYEKKLMEFMINDPNQVLLEESHEFPDEVSPIDEIAEKDLPVSFLNTADVEALVNRTLFKSNVKAHQARQQMIGRQIEITS